MKKFEKLGKKLSKEEQKNIMGGVEDGGAGCYGCWAPNMYSCWYSSSGNCTELCLRVYPDIGQCVGPVGCMGCTMN